PAPRTLTEAPRDTAPPVDPITARNDVSKEEFERLSYDSKEPEPRDDYPDNHPPKADKPSGVELSSGQPSSEQDAEIAAAQQRIKLYAFKQTWAIARGQVSEGRHRDALLALTPFYNDPA